MAGERGKNELALLTLYYPPEMFGNAPIVRTVAEEFSRRGHSLHVVTAAPHRRVDAGSGPPNLPGVNVHYVGRPKAGGGTRRQLQNWWGFALACARWLDGRDRLNVISITPPFFLPWVIRKAVERRKHRLVHWMQDMYPDALEVSGAPVPRMFSAAIRGVVRRALQVPEAIIPATDDWVPKLANGMGVRPERVHVCENWSGLDPDSVRRRRGGGPLRFIFAGNIGWMSDLETVLSAMRLALKNGRRFELDVCGSGTKLPRVRRLAEKLPDGSVSFHGAVPDGKLAEFFARADLGLVPMRPGGARASVPSKTYAYLGYGLPVFAVMDGGCQVERLIRRQGLGWIAPAGDPSAVAETMASAAAAPSSAFEEMERRARSLFAEKYAPSVGSRRFADLIESLLLAHPPCPPPSRGRG